MDTKLLERLLNSIGRSCFIKHYDLFTNPNFSTSDVVKELIESEGYCISGSQTRANCAKRIIKNNALSQSLELIIATRKIPDEIKQKAIELQNKSFMSVSL